MDNQLDPQEEASIKQTKEAIQQAIASVQTPEHADKVIADLTNAAGSITENEVAEQSDAPAGVVEAAHQIEQHAENAPVSQQPQRVLAQTAEQLAAADSDDNELLAKAVQQAMNPESLADVPPVTQEQRELLQQALLRSLKPLSYVDTRLFLAINHLPHTKTLNFFMYLLTTVMNRGDGWVAALLVVALFDHKRGKRALLDVLPALWLTTATVEFPIKTLVKRKRPFISIVRAIVVGKKPSHYSFPSGHSAAAFAGAWLLHRHFPRWTPLLYAVAGLVGFSRVYLGAHYPGDVTSGAISGTILAAGYSRLIDELTEALD